MTAPVANRGTVHALGLEFPRAVGLAAGFDRSASVVNAILDWGFGFVEVGTVTPAPVPEHNPGVAALAEKLARRRMLAHVGGIRPVIGVNLGIQPGSGPEDACRDFLHGIRAVWSSADYLVLNLTSPAAAPLCLARQRDTLQRLLAHVRDESGRLALASGRVVPLLIKWPVTLDGEATLQIAQWLRALDYDGIVATFESEDVSRACWAAYAPCATRQIAEIIGPRRTLIAVGGIDCMQRAIALRGAGARLLQVYRAFLTGGPALVQAITESLT